MRLTSVSRFLFGRIILMFNNILQILLVLLVLYLGLSLFMYTQQKNYIYFPDDQNFEKCSGFEESEKIIKGGTMMYYTEEDSEELVVYYHGNAGSACDRAFIKDRFSEKQISSIIVEYSGYSGDDREPSKDLILKDVESVDAFIDNFSYDTHVFMGTSLGSGVAAYHTTIREPDKFIAVGSFDKLSSLAKKHYPFLPTSLLLEEEYKTAEWLKDFSGEALFFHGGRDNIVPIELGRRAYDSLDAQNKEFIEIEGEGHNTVLNNEELWDEVFNLIE